MLAMRARPCAVGHVAAEQQVGTLLHVLVETDEDRRIGHLEKADRVGNGPSLAHSIGLDLEQDLVGGD